MKSVNQAQIAKELSVHQSTVSAILGGRNLNRYGEETKQKVIALARKLNYRPRHHAQVLRGAKSRIIGILDFDWSPEQSLLKAVCSKLIEQNYTPLPLNIQNFSSNLEVTYNVLADLQTEGIIVIGYYDQIPFSYFQQLQKNGIPVIVALGIKLPGICQVSINYSDLFFEITERLLRAGRKNPVLLIQPATRLLPKKKTHVEQIIQGFQRALQKYNCPFSESNIIQGTESKASSSFAYDQTCKLLKRKVRPDAIICRGDLLAAAAITACADHGVQVPEEIAITGCHNTQYAPFLRTALTSYKIDSTPIIEETVKRMLDALSNETVIEDKQILFSSIWEPVIRKSCGTAALT